MKLTKNQQYLVAGAAALVLIALVVAAIMLGKDGQPAGLSEEPTSTTDASWTVEATGITGSLPENGTPDSEQLREWALGNTDILEGAMTNMWEITVEQGIATKIEMVVVAD